MSSINRYNNFINSILPSCYPYDFSEKSRCISDLLSYMFCRTSAMFRWKGLPDTIPERILEMYLQINGNCIFYEHENELYIFTGGLGGEPDVYYQPTIYTIANPALKLNKSIKIDEECILIRNDFFMTGLLPMFSRVATQLVETDLSINIATINSRIISLISALDDRTYYSAEEYIKDIIDGKMGIISDNLFESLKTQPYAQTGNSNVITNLIELYQYQKASWYNDIGLNANYNMKRESINSGESQLNNDALLPFIDNMHTSRKDAVKKINKKYNLNISVEFDSAWEDNIEEIEIEQNNMKKESEGNNNEKKTSND